MLCNLCMHKTLWSFTLNLSLIWLAFFPLQLKIPSLFSDVEIFPALLHGDLWGGNVAEDDSGPIIFDPASFYGHSEYELAIAGMFGGFTSSFYSAYHSKIPKAPGFEKRLKLYQLFHYMNHWNHFGTGYRGSSLNIMRNLVKWLSAQAGCFLCCLANHILGVATTGMVMLK